VLKFQKSIAIIGAGNIGMAVARGLLKCGHFSPETITLTRRRIHLLDELKSRGCLVTKDNLKAVQQSDVVIIAVEPQQLNPLLDEIAPRLRKERHILVSVISGVTIGEIRQRLRKQIPVIRAMPNTAVSMQESMTCIAAGGSDQASLDTVRTFFEYVGKTLIIDEEQMIAATALGACGIAFFLRAIRAASQGGIEAGFHSEEAIVIASQTAKGAASLLLTAENHPEHEIDRVTTPRGCTIAGLNQMEHEGFSSAMIKGITVSAEKASRLYQKSSK